ncbi:hypothetical protein [Amycolatopsis pigmentata]|uniref:Uncharacterized protein n=1 Tax=Amycolatopsis pigmentata TaxID=450801 RepID=A0ABW5FLN8_9PSEU
MALSVSLLAIIVLVGLGRTAPKGTDPFFYFALSLCGAGAVALLLAGVGAIFARDRTPGLPASDREFFAGGAVTMRTPPPVLGIQTPFRGHQTTVTCPPSPGKLTPYHTTQWILIV